MSTFPLSLLRGWSFVSWLLFQNRHTPLVCLYNFLLVKGRVKIFCKLTLFNMDLTTRKMFSSVTSIEVLVINPILHSVTTSMELLTSLWSWSSLLVRLVRERLVFLVLFILNNHLSSYRVHWIALIPNPHSLYCSYNFHIINHPIKIKKFRSYWGVYPFWLGFFTTVMEAFY